MHSFNCLTASLFKAEFSFWCILITFSTLSYLVCPSSHSSVCQKVWHSGRRSTLGSLSFTPSSSPERTALGPTASPSPSSRRWPVSRSAAPCRLFTTCTMQSSTTSCTLPPRRRDSRSSDTNTLRLDPCSTRHPPSPACSVSTRTTSVVTRCTYQSASAWSHPWPSLRPAGRCCSSSTRLSPPPSPRPSRWRATSTTSSSRCPCHPPGAPSSSQAFTGRWCARGRAHLSCHSLTFLWGRCLICWGWRTFCSCSPAPCSRCRYCSTHSVSSCSSPVTLSVPLGWIDYKYLHILLTIQPYCKKQIDK